ncbi:MAG: hypothetical protein QM594_03505 [Niabella sp.]
MKRKLKPMKGILLPVIYLLFAVSCKKDISEANISEDFGSSAKDYLVLKNGEELDGLISRVSNMSDSAYNIWKAENNLKYSLYDKFVETSNQVERLEAEDDKIKVVDTSFFYFKNDMVYSKNGVLLDKILNQYGVIQIGQYILRYQNNNTFYINANEIERKSINGEKQFKDLYQTFKKASPFTNDSQKGTYARSADGVIRNPQSGQQYNYELAYQEDKINALYRYRTWLFESHIVYPTGRTDMWGTPIWSTNYRVYFQFSLQKRFIASWVNMGAFTNLSFFHVESKVGLWGKSGFVYCPGTIVYESQTFPVTDNTTPFNYTSTSATSTAMGAFPTKEIYKTNTTVDMPDYLGLPPIPGLPPSARTYTARIKINIEHNRDVLPDRYFYYEYQP